MLRLEEFRTMEKSSKQFVQDRIEDLCAQLTQNQGLTKEVDSDCTWLHPANV
jgi:hypothetical protein